MPVLRIGLRPNPFPHFYKDLPVNTRSSVSLIQRTVSMLCGNICSFSYCLVIQEDLNSLGQCEADCQMKFGVVKCVSMRLPRHQHHM